MNNNFTQFFYYLFILFYSILFNLHKIYSFLKSFLLKTKQLLINEHIIFQKFIFQTIKSYQCLTNHFSLLSHLFLLLIFFRLSLKYTYPIFYFKLTLLHKPLLLPQQTYHPFNHFSHHLPIISL